MMTRCSKQVDVGTETLCDASENKVLWKKQQSFHMATDNKKCSTFKLCFTMNMSMHQLCNKYKVNINIFEIFGRAVSIIPRFSLLLSLIIYKASASRKMSCNLMWDAPFCFHFPHTGVVNVGNIKRTLLAHFDQSLWLFFRAPDQESELKKSPDIWWNCDLSCLKWKQMRVVGSSCLGQTLVVLDQYNCWKHDLSLNSDELLKLCAELLQMRIESRDCCSVLGSSRPTRYHHLQWGRIEQS